MADLNIDEAALHERIARAGEAAVADVRDAVGRVCEEAAQAARALAALPKHSSELLQAAVVAGVQEIEFRQPPHHVAASFSTDQGGYQLAHHDREIPAGRYRVLLFVVPIGEKERA